MMPNANFRASQWVMLSLTLFALGAFAIATDGQYTPSVFVGGVQINGVPDDWTHHHVIFSDPGTEQEAIQSGHYEKWQKVVNEPRYVIQQLKKHLPVQGPAAADAAYRERWISEGAGDPAAQNLERGFGFGPHDGWLIPHIGKPINRSPIQKDWSMTSGGTGGLAAGHYPAKYQFASTSAESCADYVVFPTGITGTVTQATLIAYNNIYKSPTCTGTVPSILLSINTGGLANTSPVLSLDGTQVAFIQATPNATVTGSVTRNKTAFSVSSGTLTSSEVGLGISGTGIPAGDTIATVTSSTAGTLTTQATATDGPETLTISSSLTELVLLKIGGGGGTAVSSPVSPTAVTNANYRSCTGPCYTTLTLDNNPTDTNSAPFYVYPGSGGSPDTLYVGDDDGNVHMFTNVFLTGTPAEVTTNWPVTASTEATPGLDSPIYDSVSGDIFVGDASGYLHQFAPPSTTAATVYTSGHLAYNTGGLVDPPVIDDTSGTDLVYQFVGYSDYTDRPTYMNVFATSGTLSIAGGTSFGTGVYFPNGIEYTKRPASTSTVMHAGTFDNLYFTSGGTAGNIYTCADGILYQVPVAGIITAIGTNGATPDGTVNMFSIPTGAATPCSPVTEFYNSSTSTDYLFMSVDADAIASGTSTCTGACVLNYIAPASGTTGTPTAGLSATGGTSGIIIDNSGAGGGSEIYFTSLGSESCNGVSGTGSTGNGTGSCAVQATQSGLN